MARKTVKRKAAPKRGPARKARRSTRAARRPARRARAAARPSRRKTAELRSVAVPPGEAADRPSLLEGIDVDPPPPTERDVAEWDGLDSP